MCFRHNYVVIVNFSDLAAPICTYNYRIGSFEQHAVCLKLDYKLGNT